MQEGTVLKWGDGINMKKVFLMNSAKFWKLKDLNAICTTFQSVLQNRRGVSSRVHLLFVF